VYLYLRRASIPRRLSEPALPVKDIVTLPAKNREVLVQFLADAIVRPMVTIERWTRGVA
jgi:hypothetical protein